jgi:hypothetical protein
MAIRPLSKQGGIISKIRRRLTVQGESETIDGVLPSRPEAKEQTEEVEDVSFNELSSNVISVSPALTFQ